jgi:hypothetical protein
MMDKLREILDDHDRFSRENPRLNKVLTVPDAMLRQALVDHDEAVSRLAGSESARGADLDALPAVEALVVIHHGSSIYDGHRPFPADFDAGPALRALLARHFRAAGPDQSDIGNLRPGAGVRAVGAGEAKLVVHLQLAGHPIFEKLSQLPLFEQGFKFLRETVPGDGPVGTARRPEAGLDLIPLDLFLHAVEKTLLAGTDVLQGDGGSPPAGRFLFDPLLHPLADEEGDVSHLLLRCPVPPHESVSTGAGYPPPKRTP